MYKAFSLRHTKDCGGLYEKTSSYVTPATNDWYLSGM